MSSKIELAIFDLDGTLLDTSGGILASVSHVIEQNHLKELSSEDLLSFIGPPIQESFKKAYGIDDKKAQLYGEQFRDRYKDHDLLIAKPYNGIYTLMDGLKEKGIETAVATYKREDYAITILKHFGFDRYANLMHGADNYNKLKKKDIILKCIEESERNDYERIVYVGDTQSDLNAAKELGIKFVGVNYGFGFKNINGYAENPLEIEGIMEEL